MDNMLPVGGLLTQHRAGPGPRAVHPGVDLEEDDAMRPHIDEAIHATERALEGCQGRPLNLLMT